jgi:hypothetical protein
MAFVSFLLCVAAEVLNYLFLQSFLRFGGLPWDFCFSFFPFPHFFVNFSPWKLDSILGNFKLVCMLEVYVCVVCVGVSVCLKRNVVCRSLPRLFVQAGRSFSSYSHFPLLIYFIST